MKQKTHKSTINNSCSTNHLHYNHCQTEKKKKPRHFFHYMEPSFHCTVLGIQNLTNFSPCKGILMETKPESLFRGLLLDCPKIQIVQSKYNIITDFTFSCSMHAVTFSVPCDGIRKITNLNRYVLEESNE